MRIRSQVSAQPAPASARPSDSYDQSRQRETTPYEHSHGRSSKRHGHRLDAGRRRRRRAQQIPIRRSQSVSLRRWPCRRVSAFCCATTRRRWGRCCRRSPPAGGGRRHVASLAYGPAPDLAERLARTDIYIWLPAGEDAVTPADQRAILAKWLDAGGGRQIHFHWNDGTRDADGLPVTHTAAYDAAYVKALDIDYAALSRRQDEAIALLRSGDVHVTTPDGTDLRFRVGDRPFNKQDGDASKARMAQARVRVDREVDFAGVLRVAPIESSVNGVRRSRRQGWARRSSRLHGWRSRLES